MEMIVATLVVLVFCVIMAYRIEHRHPRKVH